MTSIDAFAKTLGAGMDAPIPPTVRFMFSTKHGWILYLGDEELAYCADPVFALNNGRLKLEGSQETGFTRGWLELDGLYQIPGLLTHVWTTVN